MDDELEPVTLTHDEIVILAAIVRQIVLVDGELSEEEVEGLSAIPRRLAMTDDEWDTLWSEGMKTYPNADAAKEAALGIDRRSARELVYELLYTIANEDHIVDAEWDVLEWLSEAWRAKYD